MQTAAIVMAAIVLLINLLTHRFQRATLALANLQTGGNGDRKEIGRLQMAMTPDWIAYFSLIEYLLAVIAAILLFVGFSWWGVIAFAVLYLSGLFAGLVGLVIPIMPHSWNLAAVEKHLERNRLSSVIGRRQQIGATDDLTESMHLSYLVGELRENYTVGKMNVEKIAAGYLDG